MPQFEYQVKDAEGKTLTGVQESSDLNAVISALREKGFLIIRVLEIKQKTALFSVSSTKSTQGKTESGKRGRVKIDDLVVFSRQMATMVEAGVPMVQSLNILSEQSEKAVLKETLIDVHDQVQSGKSFSEALEKHKKVFSTFFVSMIHAGESSGRLDEILDRLAAYIEKTSALQKKVRSALIYPAVVSLIALVITSGMLTFVIPKFAEIFNQLNAPLPTPTRLLIAFSIFLRTYLILILIGIALSIFLLIKLFNTKAGRLWFDTKKLTVPVFGPLLLKVAVSKFSRTLSTLIKSGVPILTSLEIVSKTSGNRLIENTIQEVKDSIKGGENISGPLGKKKVFPPMVVRMISIGEETGELEKMLSKVADFYDTQVDASVEGLTSIIEPLIIAFLAIIIGGIVIAMFLPILTLTSVLK